MEPFYLAWRHGASAAVTFPVPEQGKAVLVGMGKVAVAGTFPVPEVGSFLVPAQGKIAGTASGKVSTAIAFPWQVLSMF